MKFFCEYCGCRIDAEKEEKCPNCGASYNKNKTFIRMEEEKRQREEKNEALKDDITKTALKGVKAVKWIFIIPVIVFLIIFVTIIINFIGLNKKNNIVLDDNINQLEQDFEEAESALDKIIEEDDTKIEPVAVEGINNYANITEYGFMVTGYEVVTSKWSDDYTGDNECVKFYFQVKNTSDKEIKRQDVNCIVDGVAQKQSMFGHNTMTYLIGKDLTVKGDMEFMVPKNATSYDIKYGDYITIHIEK